MKSYKICPEKGGKSMQILWATQSDPGQSICDRSANKILRRGGDTARATWFRVFVGQCWPLMLHCLGFIFLDNSASEGWAETGASSSSPLQHGLCLKFQTACLCDVHWLYFIFFIWNQGICIVKCMLADSTQAERITTPGGFPCHLA